MVFDASSSSRPSNRIMATGTHPRADSISLDSSTDICPIDPPRLLYLSKIRPIFRSVDPSFERTFLSSAKSVFAQHTTRAGG